MKRKNRYLLSILTLAVCLAATPNGRAEDPPPGKTTADLLGDLKKSSETAADPEVKALGADLGSKVGKLNDSLADNPVAQGQLRNALGGVVGNSSPVGTLSTLQQLSQAKLTADQTKLAKDVYHTGSAYLVQKNLGSVEGAQSDVAQVVSSLRKGSPVEALPALKNISQNAKMTQPQKEFVASLTKSYAPGVQKAEDLLKGLPGIGK